MMSCNLALHPITRRSLLSGAAATSALILLHPFAASAAANQMANPAAWWNLLQEQFAQAVNTAMATEPVAKPAAKDGAAQDAATPAGKPAARKPAAKRAPKAPPKP